MNAGVSTSYLYLVPAAGGAPRQLTAKFDLNVGTPVWSRDGKTVFFSANVLEANEVFSADVASGTVTQVSKIGASVNLAEISGDGSIATGTLTKPNAPAEVFKSDLKFTKPSALT